MNQQERKDLADKYAFISPQNEIIVLKRIKEENKGIVTSGFSEAKSWGRVIARQDYMDDYRIGDLVAFNEFEGDELFRYGLITEDDIIAIKSSNILLIIREE